LDKELVEVSGIEPLTL